MTGAATVLAAAFVGDVLARVSGLPIPGPALGMAILMLFIALGGGRNAEVETLFDRIAPHMSIVFIPPAAGFISSLDLIAQHWLSVVVAVGVGTILAIAAAGLAFQLALVLTNEGEPA